MGLLEGDNRKLAIHIGPASIRRDEAYIKVSATIVDPIKTIGQLDELIDTINDPQTSDLARDSLGCHFCDTAKYVESGPEHELRIVAEREKGKTDLKLAANCSVLNYAYENGFVADAACMEAKLPTHLVISTENNSPPLGDIVKTILQRY